MRAPRRFEYETDSKSIAEAMMAATTWSTRGRHRVPVMLLGFSLTVLTGFGGVAIAALICRYLDVQPTWWLLVGWVLGSGTYLLHQNWLIRHLAHISARAPMHRGVQSMDLTEAGLVYTSEDLRWTTPWSKIDEVSKTKNAVAMIVGGVAFYIPKSSIGDEEAVAQLIADIEAALADR